MSKVQVEGEIVTKLFCIISVPRSGSNRLHTLLNSHPAVVCHGELFNRKAIYSALRPWPEISTAGKLATLLARNAAPRRFLDDHILQSRKAWPEANAIGFKLFPYHSRRILRYVCTSQTYEVIYLKRNNRVLQYASDRIARRTNAWTSTAPGSQGGETEKVDFSMRDFSRYVARLDRYDTVVSSALGDKPFLEIVYEDMDRSLSAIQERLGIEALNALRSPVQKQNPDNWVERFSNPDRVLEALSSTEWAVHLQ
jgi:LPS sulfotransferase NodH